MEKINFTGQQKTSLIITGESLEHIDRYISAENVFIVTDINVLRHYGSIFPKFPVFAADPGEVSKTVSKAAEICRWLLENDADRDSFILGIGGGVVTDLAGYVASTYMRGLRFGFVATSLMAQADASIGGKNGVNIGGYKNIIGTINQPEFVICDTKLLQTLPDEEFLNGITEVIKHALIADASLLSFIEKNTGKILSRDAAILEQLVYISVKIKTGIVELDERESGERRKLNLGHTWGHAVEKITGIPHGQAVGIGLVFSSGISVKRGLLSSEEKKRIENILKGFGLPLNTEADHEIIFEAMLKDKKKTMQGIRFVLMKGLGDVIVETIPVNELRQYALS
ncbi:MAG: 3-dehydroquinate synthase [Bacteroidota bacterium]